MPAGFQQPPVLKLSPDYKVFINGLGALPIQKTVTDAQLAPLNRSTVEYRDLNTDISGCTISMSIESSPGTASFMINVPRHRTDALAYMRDGEIMVKPMMEVHIYLRGRFNASDNSPQYYLAVWGIVSTVQEQYSDGAHSISVSCTDMLRWWEITKVVTSPAAVDANPVPGQEITALSSIYTGLDAHTIIYDLGKISMQNFSIPHPINVGDSTKQTQQTNLFVREATTTAEYWVSRFKAIRSAMRMYAFAGFIEGCGIQDLGSVTADGTAKTDAQIKADARSLESDISAGNYTFTKVRTCDNQAQAMYPYKTPESRDVGQSESQQRTKLEIAQEVAKNVHWEFFLDMDGTIVFKPPFYNLDVRSNEPSVVRDIDIINYTKTETEQGALTSIYVTARRYNTQQPQTKFGGWWIDWPLALTIGLRHAPREEWRLMTADQAKTFAQAELVRHNAMLDTVDITIPGRPELRLGYPIYIEPFDSFYYVYNINHTIQAGGTFTTTLSMKAKRARIRDSAGRPRPLLAAVQDQRVSAEPQATQNGQPCPQLANSAIQAIEDRSARADATSANDVPSGKGKSTLIMRVSNQTASEQADEERKQDEAQEILKSDPCNKKYEKMIRNKGQAAAAAAKHNRLTQDGVAPGEWILKDNHPVIPVLPKGTDAVGSIPVDGKNLVDEIQLSDQQGYKLFGPFLYGRFVAMSPSGTLQVSPDRSSDADGIESIQSDPGASGGSDPSAGLRYMVNPNIGAVTLRLGGGTISRTGAGVSGEAFVATRPNSEEASKSKQLAPRSIQIGKVSVDTINNCESGTVAITAGSDTKEAMADYAKLRSCTTQRRVPPETKGEITLREVKAFEEENGKG